MSEDSQARLAAMVAEKVAEFSRKTPAERFQYLVDRGLIDAQGRPTTRAGGDAQPVIKK